MRHVVLLFILASVYHSTRAADNSEALVPPLGWMSWERFMCNTDCDNYPNDCISEKLIKTTTDVLAQPEFTSAGFKYVLLDDCWMSTSRDAEGRLQADSKRFPAGIRDLALYVRSRGLKLGLYLSVGNLTRSGYPGSKGSLQLDATTLRDWEVDMVKLDAYGLQGVQADQAYEDMASYLNHTLRPMLINCVWPLYSSVSLEKVQRACNTFRTYKDIYDGWESLEDIIHHVGDNSRSYVNFTGPGSWVDADQVLVGDFGLSPDQQRLQMAVWSVMASPIFMSADVRNISPDAKAILLNKRLLEISQDSLATMGLQISVIGQVRVWMRPILPRGSFALLLLYENISGGPSKVSLKLQDMGFTTAAVYNFTDVFTGAFIGSYKPWYTFSCQVNPTGVRLFKALAIP